MRRASVFSVLAVALTGCTTTPSPLESVAEGNFQARLTTATGAIEGGIQLIGGGVEGDGCILTVLGQMPPGLTATMAKDACEAHLGAP